MSYCRYAIKLFHWYRQRIHRLHRGFEESTSAQKPERAVPPAHLAVFQNQAPILHQMIRSARSSYESWLALASSKSPKPFFAYVRRKRELRLEIESVIVDGVEQPQPVVLSEAFRSYFLFWFVWSNRYSFALEAAEYLKYKRIHISKPLNESPSSSVTRHDRYT